METNIFIDDILTKFELKKGDNTRQNMSTGILGWFFGKDHIIPNEIYKEFRSDFKKIRKDGYI